MIASTITRFRRPLLDWRKARCRVGLAVCLTLTLTLLTLAGCTDSSSEQKLEYYGDEEVGQEWREQLFRSAIDNLNRLETVNPSATRDQIFERLSGLRQGGTTAAGAQADPAAKSTLLAAWPESAMLVQILNWLNQWMQSLEPGGDWKPDDMVATLPEPLREMPQMKDLDRLSFTAYDSYALRETVWLRDLSNWVRGESSDDLARAKRLFDWTVRNIRLEREQNAGRAGVPPRVPLLPWETLMFGQGTGLERAWLFMLLARQQGIDAVLLALPAQATASGDTDSSDAPPSGPLQPWAIGVLVDGELYIFDPALGMPIPAPDGIGLGEEGQLEIQPATLSQIAADDGLLRQLDIGPEQKYPLKSEALQNVVALIEASPIYLARRMELVQSRLIGQQRMVLSVDATALAERLKVVPHVVDAQLWSHPLQTIDLRSRLSDAQLAVRLAAWMPLYATTEAPLRTGRVLHLKGQFEGQEGAVRCYLEARPSDQSMQEAAADQAKAYLDAISESLPESARKEREPEVRQQAVAMAQADWITWSRAKQDATCWLGLIAYERGNYATAIDYFLNRLLMASSKENSLENPWTHLAWYNLGRAYELVGQPDEAVRAYMANKGALNYHGSLLRARWLKTLQIAATEEPPSDQVESPPADEPPVEAPQVEEPMPQEPEVVEPEAVEPEVEEPVAPGPKAEAPWAYQAPQEVAE